MLLSGNIKLLNHSSAIVVVVIGRPIHRIWQVPLYVMLSLVNVTLLKCKCHSVVPATKVLEIAAGHRPIFLPISTYGRPKF